MKPDTFRVSWYFFWRGESISIRPWYSWGLGISDIPSTLLTAIQLSITPSSQIDQNLSFSDFYPPFLYVKIWFLFSPTKSMIWRDVAIRSPSYRWFLEWHSVYSCGHVVVDCLPPNIYFAPSNIRLGATQQQNGQQRKRLQHRAMHSLFRLIERNMGTATVYTTQCGS